MLITNLRIAPASNTSVADNGFIPNTMQETISSLKDRILKEIRKKVTLAARSKEGLPRDGKLEFNGIFLQLESGKLVQVSGVVDINRDMPNIDNINNKVIDKAVIGMLKCLYPRAMEKKGY